MSMFKLFMKREPKAFDEGLLDVGSGHRIFYRQFGNPAGVPVLCFHGGPGSSSKPRHAAVFDLKKLRVILFDQRGCGKSQFKDALKDNTAPHLLADARKILEHLGIQKTHLFGGSWGSTLALLFAEAHPQMVKKLVVNKVFLARQNDVDWTTYKSEIFFSDMMAKILAECGSREKLVGHFHKLAMSGDRQKLLKAFRLFGAYEGTLSTLDPKTAEVYPETDENLRHFQIYMHYLIKNFGVSENQVLKNIGKVKAIPTLILHNRLDLVCPLEQAWDLHKAMPKSRLVIVPDRGHTTPMLNKYTKAEMEKFL